MGEDSAQSPPFTSEDILRENVSANSARLIPEAIASTRVTDRSRDGRLEIFPQGSWKAHRVAASVTLPQCLSSVTWFRNMYAHAKRAVTLANDRRSAIDLLPARIDAVENQNSTLEIFAFVRNKVALNDYGKSMIVES